MSYSATDQHLLRQLIFLFVVSLAVTAASSLETSDSVAHEESNLRPSEFDSLAEIDSSGGADEERRRKGRFFNFRRTSTTTTTTSTTVSSNTICYTSSTIAAICSGRKKRALEAVIRSLPENGPAELNIEHIQPTRRQMMDYLASEHRREMTKREDEAPSSSDDGDLMSSSFSSSAMVSANPRQARFFGYTTTTSTATSTTTVTSYTSMTSITLLSCLPTSFAYNACG